MCGGPLCNLKAEFDNVKKMPPQNHCNTSANSHRSNKKFRMGDMLFPSEPNQARGVWVGS